MATEKKKFPMKKADFMDKAKPIMATVNGAPIIGNPKEFSTGSVGYNFTGKFPVELNGEVIFIQFSGNGTAIGSKEAE